ncbi:hypothetical protein MRX96_023037 [Rhipicephalus microplus]
MVASCVVHGCANRLKKGCGLTFHLFPKDPVTRSLWEWAVRREKSNAKDWDYFALCTLRQSVDHLFDIEGKHVKGGYKFMAAYKRLLVPTEVTSSSSGHCSEDVLSVSNATTPSAMVDPRSNLTDMHKAPVLQPDDHDNTHRID